MPKKKYTLTISYNDESDQVEYITESLDNDEEDYQRYFEVGTVDITEYWDKEALDLIDQMYDIGDA